MMEPFITGASADAAKVICIVVHGRGQSQQDMRDMIVQRLALKGIRYILPKSDQAGWYLARAIDPLTDDTRAELQDSLRQISDLITAERAACPGIPLMLCGFSQGACLSAELLLDQPGIADAACLFTACRIGAQSDNLPVNPLDGLNIYASCGDADPWIPAVAHHRMLGDLTRAGARLRCDMFPGRPHAITDTEIAALSDMLQALAGGTKIWDSTT
ncbi:MAG: dienelactone hydrolase family protein [Loktanella sp.]|nr:dienelactone hydrolase family protein [Loktanella sp.]